MVVRGKSVRNVFDGLRYVASLTWWAASASVRLAGISEAMTSPAPKATSPAASGAPSTRSVADEARALGAPVALEVADDAVEVTESLAL